MCGVSALFASSAPFPARLLVGMTDAIRHRGPDDEGYLLVAADGRPAEGRGGDTTATLAAVLPPAAEMAPALVGLGHRRLSIVDVTPAGHQPMAGENGTWIVYNGEIYNHRQLRSELARAGHRFQTTSDTEVLLVAYAQWGVGCLDRLNGMFAFVLYDARNGTVFAARDRFGVKPLYCWRGGNGLLAFASEIKQFVGLPGWAPKLSHKRAYDFLNWGVTDHESGTLFEGVEQVPAGHFLAFPLTSLDQARPRPWYQLPHDQKGMEFGEATRRFRELFMDSVRLRMQADVEVGTALSGGLDSSSIVCAVAALRASGSAPAQRSFSARSREQGADEGPFISAVVEKTKVNDHHIHLEAEGLLSSLEQMVWAHDEPFGSSSIFAEWSVFRRVAETPVKVTLDGHGADEILAGYRSCIGPRLAGLFKHARFAALLAEWRAYRGIGYSGRTLAAGMVDRLIRGDWRDRLRRLSGHTHAAPSWIDFGKLAAEPSSPFGQEASIADIGIDELMRTSLPMQLKWTDRNSMASSIESRAPFLDYRLVEFACSLPEDHKIGGGLSKRVMREALRDLLPEAIINRRDKMGFVTPEQVWVQRDAPERFRQLLRETIDVSSGLLTEDALAMGNEIIDGRRPYHAVLWRLISFGAWAKRFGVTCG